MFDPELLETRIQRRRQKVGSQKKYLSFIQQNFKCRSGTEDPVLSAEFPVSQVDVHRSEEEEVDRGKAGPPHGTYIIPVCDITMETNPSSALVAGRYGEDDPSKMNLQPDV